MCTSIIGLLVNKRGLYGIPVPVQDLRVKCSGENEKACENLRWIVRKFGYWNCMVRQR
jgi:hypothetical protein